MSPHDRNYSWMPVVLLMSAAVLWLACGPVEGSERKPWKVPARRAKKKNPVAADAASIAAGRALYIKQCASCHGKGGRGDGPAGVALKVQPRDHTSPKMKLESDGALYWKIKVGRSPMPSFRGKLKSGQVWNIINYMRTLTGGKGDKTDKKAPDKKAPDKKSSDAKAPGKKVSNKKASATKVSDAKASGTKTSDTKASSKDVSGKKVSNNKAYCKVCDACKACKVALGKVNPKKKDALAPSAPAALSFKKDK